MKPGTHLLQQLDPMEVPISCLQRTGSEAGYGRLNVYPILRSASICIYDLLPLNYPIIPFYYHAIWGLPSINWSFFSLIAEFAHYSHVHVILVLVHKNKINK